MNDKRLAWKVGWFVFGGLVLIAALLLNFSKKASLFGSTYELRLICSDVGGIRQQAGVLMSGVKIGNVIDAELKNDYAALDTKLFSPDIQTNSFVIIRIRISEIHQIPANASFSIDSMGFLGDQFISIKPPYEEKPIGALKDGDYVICESPFDFQKQVHNISSAVESAKGAITNLNRTINNLNENVLNEQSSKSITQTLSNFNRISEHSLSIVSNVNAIVSRNGEKIDTSFDKISLFSDKLNDAATQMTNSIVPDLKIAITDVKNAAQTATNILADVQQGKGVVGDLLKNEQLKAELGSVVTNLNSISANLATTTSNLNSRGLWGIMWRNKEPKPEKMNGSKVSPSKSQGRR